MMALIFIELVLNMIMRRSSQLFGRAVEQRLKKANLFKKLNELNISVLDAVWDKLIRKSDD